MPDHIQSKVDADTSSAIDNLEDDRGTESTSKAVEIAVQTGLRRLGYLDGGRTPAQALAESVAVGVFHVGATLMGLALLGSFTFFGAAIGVLAASLSLAVGARVAIPRLEPRLTNSLPKIEVSRHGD